ncbi:hypothetical protein [Ramlibacter alkalitolerans]|uniref:DUF4156 domain-containing protein n=1 Tax=Ramlibacter alkalitolerans TaxID=2039631 RepID=A0ABS1JMM5_9BURK|nr:hypothetical protein [Ramlibacter alkalitolerans]MBL0425482.1 hypothetical protein [Ramlibacter alkalitolerans]
MRSLSLRAARAPCMAAVLLAAACLPSPPSRAGEAAASFQLTLQVLPEAPGSCSASSGAAGPQLTCRPSVVAPVPAGAEPQRQAGALHLRSESPLRVAGEMVEVGAENHYAWLENSPVAWSERSSRRVVAGGREYVEMTFSW